MNNKPLLSMKSITKSYTVGGEKIVALKPIDLEVYEGDYISIVGPSGSGKSTLLSILGLIDLASSGDYFIKKTNTVDLGTDQLSTLRNLHFGFIFQSFHLIDDLNVYENVALPLRYREERLTESQINERVTSVLAKVQMEHRIHFKPNQLSGGQQQRIAIARALAGNPSILLVDEPTGNLDTNNGNAIMSILDELNQNGTTICMVTHDKRYSDHARTKYHLLDGGIEKETRKPAESM